PRGPRRSARTSGSARHRSRVGERRMNGPDSQVAAQAKMAAPLSRRLVAECVATAFLVAAVVGSGIMGERLAAGSVALALLANTLATGAALVAMLLAFGPISGAHLNPAVTLADAWMGGITWRETPAYLVAQIAGALAG